GSGSGSDSGSASGSGSGSGSGSDSSSGAVSVSLDVNDTATHTDDVILWGTNPIPVRVTLHDSETGVHTVNLQLADSSLSLASLSQTTLTLADGQSAEVWVTA